MKLSGKIWSLTGVLLLSVIVVAVFSIVSIRKMLSANRAFEYASELDTFLIEKEVDHLNWAGKVKDLFLTNGETLDVTLDHTKCALGSFLYGDASHELVEKYPELSGLLGEIKEPHKHLHGSAVDIKNAWRSIHPGLNLTLAKRLDDHRRWAASLSQSLLETKEITVELDPTKCTFGKWLASDECSMLVSGWPEFGQVMDLVKEHHRNLHNSAKKIKIMADETEKRDIYLSSTMPELAKVSELFHEAQALEAVLEERQSEAAAIFNITTVPALQKTKTALAALADRMDEIKVQTGEDMVSRGERSKTTSTVVSILAFILAMILSHFFIKSITAPVYKIINWLNDGAEEVSSASQQISSAGQSLAEGAFEQAASIEETSSSLEEMSAMTRQNADNANMADSLMEKVNSVLALAIDSMTTLIQSMTDISTASDDTSKIIKTIDEIAFQTNLLALNAAVEAARAGEAGAGFAVVADEVRNLAMRAAEAAKNTAQIIEETIEKVDHGSDIVSKTNDAFKQVVENAGKIGGLVAEIATASTEQASGIGQLNQAVMTMDKVVQQNAANAEESASAGEEMSAQATQMKGAVSKLVVLVHGAGNSNPPSEG